MVPRTDRYPGYLCQFADPSTDLPGLHHSRFFPKHIQQVPGYEDEIIIRLPDLTTTETTVPDNAGPL